MTQRTPSWMVQAVFDPDGTGHDFAYTIGLGSQGLPELHMTGRPTHGDDVGADFLLSSRDLCGFLNHYAPEWLDGELEIGDEREDELDDGMTTVVITVGKPVDRLSVEAFGAQSSHVVPLRWELVREPIGTDPGLSPAARTHWRQRITASRSSVATAAGLPPIPDACDLGTRQTYGPLTPWVILLAHSAATASPSWIVRRTLEDYEDAGIALATARLAALARPVGRVEALDASAALARQTSEVILRRREFRDQARALGRAGLCRKHGAEEIARWVRTSVRVLLGTAVLEDVLPAAVTSSMRQPWNELLACKHGAGELARGR